MVRLTIDSHIVEVPEGTSILDAAKSVQIKIPTLCHHPDLPATAACGICIVKVNGKMLRSCCTPVAEGMEVITRDADIIDARRTVLKLTLSKHPNECLTCLKNDTCELRKLASDFGIRDTEFENITPTSEEQPVDDTTKSIVLDPRKCILCGRCVEVCQNTQNVWALSMLQRGIKTHISPAADENLVDSPCIKCGQCTAHCPTGALTERDDTQYVWDMLQDKEKYCVVQIAPAVRVAIGEAFGFAPGTITTGKIYAALRRLGFDAVFDTNFGADVTIMEEGSEFIERFTKGEGVLPMITSCCPAWVDYMEKYYPEMIPHFSSCKSPHEIVGALSKTYYADKIGVETNKMRVVSIMPCTAKKFEILRSEEMFSSGFQDVDVSLTTRELARMIKQAGIDFANLPDEGADSPLGSYTGAATVFGFTGGVMEAALRTVHYVVTGQEMADDALEIKPILGLDKGIKEMTMNLAGKEVRIAVAHGIGHVQALLEKVKDALQKGEEPPYHFIEVMACEGGCIGGGGQPLGVTDEIRKARMAGLMTDDKNSAKRCSHQNPDIKKLYDEFLGTPLSNRSHHLLHTSYKERKLYNK
ncbi:MAG: 2Fe-2S iron-sulfur cluster binding domain-containing protein [Alphaproteobacteria bacterium]|nr:2Fe-2S iron-sulfur cluster binding domain-containing protein [Alphaproteobacteria bacterium]